MVTITIAFQQFMHFRINNFEYETHLTWLHSLTTVEHPNKGHFGIRAFVLFSEVVLWWEV